MYELPDHPNLMPHDHGQEIDSVLKKMPPEEAFTKAADTFQQM